MKKETELERILAPIITKVNWAEIIRNDMHKTPQWFYQHLHANIVNGKPVELTEAQRKRLSDCLIKLGTQIITTAEKL